jgi:hypothetical protein
VAFLEFGTRLGVWIQVEDWIQMRALLAKCNHKDRLFVGNDNQMCGLGHSSVSYVSLDCFIRTDTNVLQCR